MIELHPEEEIKLMVRKHWFVFIEKVFFVVLLLALPFIVLLLINVAKSYGGADAGAATESFFVGVPVTFLTILWIFFVWIWGFILWTDYYLDTWIVTNKRIISIDQKGFFRREISTFRMERVQDITTKVGGFIPTLFNFGNITVQTAGDNRSFVMRGAPAPNSIKEVVSTILEAKRNAPDYKGGGL